MKMVTQEIIVPPDDKFLNVKITSDKEVYSLANSKVLVLDM